MTQEPRRDPGPAPASPVMTQYHDIKQAHPGCLLFFRMGDFYELFFDDAVAAAPALDIALTKRGRHEGADIPMCGVPVHTAETYMARLIRAGFKVAMCEQVEDPATQKARGAKGPLRRAVVRVVTAGTLTEDGLLDARRHNYLAGIAEAAGELGLAWLDLSTGAFSLAPTTEAALGADLARLAPGEILIPERLLERPTWYELFADWKPALTPLANARFDSETGRRRLEGFYGVKALDGFGQFSRAEIAAAGALVDYVGQTQQGSTPHLEPPQRLAPGSVMHIDAATRRNLELVTTLSGERRGSLLSVIDRTLTAAGARLLADHLAAPLTDPAQIAARLDAIAFFLDRADLRADLRERLRRCPDIERAMTRLTLGRGGPRDLGALHAAMEATAELRRMLTVPSLVALPEPLAAAERGLGEHYALVDRLGRALAVDLPLFARDGGFIAPGYSTDLDEYRELRDESRRTIAALQARYAEATSVGSLRIRYNNVIGYYIEVPAAQAGKLGTDYIHRQTMAGAMRYTTVELGELESKIANAADRALALELRLFADLVEDVMARRREIADAAAALAVLDLAAAFAERAGEGQWVRPEIDSGTGFEIEGGRHPTVEAALHGTTAFVANDCTLGAGDSNGGRIWLVTGPNMAGKSTFLRQNALIAILAQMGSYVPAQSARIGVVDRLFSRVGAADDLARGRSTFMVEMVETASILNQAGPHSFVILDEIGRGTATYDGLSIAWAALEHLHEVNRCRALFATHFHELTALAQKLPALACHTMRVKEWQGDVVFLHEVAPGTADRSYGIHVARLAGLPDAVTARAEEVLTLLEQSEAGGAPAKLIDDLPLFRAAAKPAPAVARESAAEAALKNIRPDELTPREALEVLYRLRGLLDE
ncbi:MAG TPA: DNA mismatch repair protein MutS [Stellaceae bacterium]|jgi:DNA mismatch repair protein MutS|nr:DNA mismatch repair protein MutS [Stellaceae bacterium]